MKRKEVIMNGEDDLANALKKIIRKSLREDKRKWEDEVTKKELGIKEQWQGLRYIGQPFKPKRYARKDRHGRLVNLDMRAEATKEYLEKDQWGKQEHQKQQGPPQDISSSSSNMTTKERKTEERRKEIEEKSKEIMDNDRQRYKDVIWNTKPPTTAEIKVIIKKFKKGKAPGPDGITTDLIKDLSWEALEAIQKMISKWWKE